MDKAPVWKRKKNAIYSWNECSNCGNRVYDNIFGEQFRPPICPCCGKEMAKEEKEKPFDIRKLPPIGKCLAHTCIQDRLERDLCLHCGFNETEFQRRIHLPWSVNKDNKYYKNVTVKRRKV